MKQKKKREGKSLPMKLPTFVRRRIVNRSPENEEQDGGEAKKGGRNEIERQR